MTKRSVTVADRADSRIRAVTVVGRCNDLAMLRPEPIQISDWEIAEGNAARWMRFWGYADAHVTGGGADGGLDVTSSAAIAQVKFKASMTGGPDLQRLAGAGYSHRGKTLIFFTGSGYTPQAIEFADVAKIALFTYRLDGAVSAVNRSATQIATGPLTTRASSITDAAPTKVIGSYLPQFAAPKKTVSPRLGIYIVISAIVGVFCFFKGLELQQGASTFGAFIAFTLLFVGLISMFIAWVMWEALRDSQD